MKTLMAICMIVAATLSWAGEKAAPVPSSIDVIKGEVLEIKDVETYTYLRLKTQNGETWAVVGKTPVKNGTQVTIGNVTVVNNFESKLLKKTFKKILFGSLIDPSDNAKSSGNTMAMAHAGLAKPAEIGDVHVPKASGENARTVEEIVTKATELKDKPVLVRGKVVKYSSAIMGKNWVHLRDGTGTDANDSNDVLVTTMDQTKIGDTVTFKGVIRTDKNFGSGYSYKVLVEDAVLQQR